MFLLRSNNRVKHLHGSFIRKMCASNSRSFQWVTLSEIDSIKISSGFQAASNCPRQLSCWSLGACTGWHRFSWQLSHVLALCACPDSMVLCCSATKKTDPTDLPGWELYTKWESHQNDTGPSKLTTQGRGLLQAPWRPLCQHRSVVPQRPASSEVLSLISASIREYHQCVERPQLLKCSKFAWAAGDVAQGAALLSTAQDLPPGEESCSVYLVTSLTESTREWTSPSFSLPSTDFSYI